MASPALTRALDERGIAYTVLPHPHTERALDEAHALGVEAGAVAKTLVVASPQGYIRAVIPASERLDLHKVRDLLGAGSKKVHLASEDDLARDYPEFELGAVPPVGGRPDPVLVDRRLAEREEVVFEAGTHDESVRLRTVDLLSAAEARVVDLCQE